MNDNSKSPELHTSSSHAQTAAAALGSVYAANQLGKALADDDKEKGYHYLKAAVGAAVAVGAFHVLQKKSHIENHSNPESEDEQSHGGEHHRRHHHHHHHHHNDRHDGHHDDEPPHHTRRLLEEAAGAYALGKQLLGDKRHHVAHLIAEAMGAVGLIRDLSYRTKDRYEG